MFRRRSDCSAIGQYQRGGGEVGRVTMRHHPAGRGHPSHGVLVQGRGRGTVVHVSGSINSFLSDSFLKEKRTDTVTLSRDTKLALLITVRLNCSLPRLRIPFCIPSWPRKSFETLLSFLPCLLFCREISRALLTRRCRRADAS